MFVLTESATVPLVSMSTDTPNGSVASLMSMHVAAPMIQINWRSVDLATTSETASPPSPSIENSDSSSRGSMSAGALAGAVIGGVVGLSAIAAASFFMRRRRKARGNINTERTRSEMMEASLGDSKSKNVSELSSKQTPVELSGFDNPSELSGNQNPVELPVPSDGSRSVQGQS